MVDREMAIVKMDSKHDLWPDYDIWHDESGLA